jgi:hypothetical protein
VISEREEMTILSVRVEVNDAYLGGVARLAAVLPFVADVITTAVGEK